MSRRQNQLASFIQDEVSEIIHREMKDPRLGLVSIVRVEMSADLRYAKCFVSIYGSEEERKAAMDALSGAAGYIRHLLKPRMRIRHVPEVSFRLDRSMEHAESVTRTLNQIRRHVQPVPEDSPKASEPPREDTSDTD